MAKLVVNPTAANRREIALGQTLVSIGRDPSNDLVLPDAMVSRRHAVIECRGAQYYLRDCNSSNGSVVNGDRVSEKGLRDGDLVAIGSARLLFKEELDLTEGAGGKVLLHPSARPLSCPSCEAAYRRGDVFCRSCGARLPEPTGPPKLVCAACGSAVLLPAHFCSACGARLPEGSSNPLEAPLREAEPERVAAGPEAEPTSMSLPTSLSGEPPSGPGSASGSGSSASSASIASSAPRSRGAVARATAEPQPPVTGPAAVQSPAKVEPPLSPAPPPPVAGPAVAKASPSPARPAAPPESGSGSVSLPAAEASPVPAPPGLRALAALLDLGIVALAEAVLLLPLASYWWSRGVGASGPEAGLVPVLLPLVVLSLAGLAGAAYYACSWSVAGATAGQRLLDLAVVGEDGRSPIGPGRATVRVFGYLLGVLSLGIGFLLVPLTGSGLHDRIAGTRVVRRRPGVR